MSDVNPSELIRRARQGDSRLLNELIDRYRPYLKLLARLQRDQRLNAKLDDSDMVQEASMLAARNFENFRGRTEAELAAWLRTNMARVAAASVRHYTRERRNIHLERAVCKSYDRSSALLATGLLATSEPSPSEQIMQRERAVLVAEALDQLPEHYREIIILRDLQGRTLEEVGRRTGRSADSTRKMWARAVVMIRELLEGRL